MQICDALSHNNDVIIIKFDNEVRRESLTFDKNTIESFLFTGDNFAQICRSPQTSKAYFLFRIPICGDFLLVVEKSRGDVVFYYDIRETSEKEAERIFEIIRKEIIYTFRFKTALSNSEFKAKEEKAAINILKSFKALTEIKNNAYAVISQEPKTADKLLQSNIMLQARAGEKILVFCVGDETKVKAIKNSHLTTGDITIIKIAMSDYIVDEIDLIINYIADISNYNIIYVLGINHCKYTQKHMSELDKIASRIQVPIFVGIQCEITKSTFSNKAFTIELMPEYFFAQDNRACYSLSYCHAKHKKLMIYDQTKSRFIDAEIPF
ncbi:MAG: hypothetical protein ACI4KD_01420 [Oscillospiraceae bacterium]